MAPYSSGAYYAKEFARHGWRCLAVTPDEEDLPRIARGTLRHTDFADVITHRGDLPATAARLRNRGATVVLAGAEFGVPLADALAAQLGLPGNDPATSAERRDKASMARALQAGGVRSIRTLRATDVQEAVEWVRELGLGSCVVKPTDSAGSDGVAFCRSTDELRSAWRRVHGRVNAMGGRNTALVIQERVHGTQYLVNSVSWGGIHKVTDIWADYRFHTSEGHVLYDRLVLLAPKSAPDLYRQLDSYTRRALTTLGIAHGPAHTEIMLTDTGPVLIETGARPEGCLNPEAMVKATGSHHVRDAVTAVVDPQALLERPPHVLQPAYRVMLRAPHNAVVSTTGWRALMSLPGVAGTLQHITGGSHVCATKDLLTSPDSVYLIGSSRMIETSYRAIRLLEASGLYIPAEP